MKSVSYTSYTKLSCGCNAEVIACVDGALTASGTPYIEGTLAFAESINSLCGKLQYQYAITYDEGLLADPEYSLVEADVTGLICRGCLTNYIDYQDSLTQLVLMGATASRPTLSATDIGYMYMDTDLDADGLPIWWNGVKWIKADGTDA